MRFLLLSMILSTAACSGGGAETSGFDGRREQAAPTLPAWNMKVSATSGVAIQAEAENGRAGAAIACTHEPSEISVTLSGYTGIDAASSINLHAGGRHWVLSRSRITGEPGDMARFNMPFAPSFAEALSAGESPTISVEKGETLPLPTLSLEMRKAFGAACARAGGAA